jgi:Predicted transcriptional regulator
MLSVTDVAALFGISRSHAYDIVHEEGFPRIEIGSRIIVPKDALVDWIQRKSNRMLVINNWKRIWPLLAYGFHILSLF